MSKIIQAILSLSKDLSPVSTDWTRGFNQGVERAAAEVEVTESMKTVLDRESATAARHDARLDKLEAEIERLRAAAQPRPAGEGTKSDGLRAGVRLL